jgi:hypothetical protein
MVNADIHGTVDFRARSMELDDSLPSTRSGPTYVVSAGHTYVRTPAPSGTTASSAAKPWIRTTTDQRPGLAWLILGLPADPATSIETLADRLVSAQKVGADVVRGSSAVHYRIKINLLPTSIAMQGFDCAHPTPSPPVQTADVWLDSAGRVVRLRMPFEVSASGQAGGQSPVASRPVKGSMTTELFQFSEPVTIQVPTAAQTFIDPSETSGPPTAEQGPCQDTASGSATVR